MPTSPDDRKQPIPPNIWQRIQDFIKPGVYGRIELDIRDGEVLAARIIESIQTNSRCERDAA